MRRRPALVLALLVATLLGIVASRAARRAEAPSGGGDAPTGLASPALVPPLAVPSPRAATARRGGPSDAPAASAPAAPAADAVPSSVIVVCDETGAPIVGALVATRSKDDATSLILVRTDAEGHATVRAGTWVCVVAPGCVRAALDGDAIARDASPTRVVLERGRRLEAEVYEADDRTPVGDVEVLADELRPPVAEAGGARASALPPPPCDGPVDAVARTDDRGRAGVEIATRRPVAVSVSPRSWWEYADPPAVVLAPGEDRARFRLLPACRLRVVALDATTGAPLAVPFEVEHGLDGAPRALGTTSNPDETGVFDLFPSLRPGRYALAVRADGYATWTGEVLLDRPGVVVEAVARLARAAARPKGSLRLRVPRPDAAPAAATAAGRAAAEPVVLLRRLEPDPCAWDDAGALRTGEPTWDAAARVVTVPGVPPARYAVLVVDRAHGLAGAVRDLEVLPDQETDRAVALAPGVLVDVASLAEGAGSVGALRLSTPDGFLWPVVALREGERTTFDAAGEPVPADERLGPLPGPSVVATWTAADGAARTRVVGGR